MEKQTFDIKNFLIKLFICIAAMGSICGVPFMSCKDCSRNTGTQPERDIISFNVPTSVICDSMKVMNGIMDKLNPAKKQPRIISWFIEHNRQDFIDINGNEFIIKDLKPEYFNIFSELNSSEKLHFYKLILFFISNNLTACRQDFMGWTSRVDYFYDYRNYYFLSEDGYNREVLLQDTNFNYSSDSVERSYKVLDKKDGLILLKGNHYNYLREHKK
jgi:hypothetical protein